MLSEVSRGLVRLYKRFYGKGPVKSKSYLIDDTLVCLLQGGLTVIEQTLIESGRADVVDELRRTLHSAADQRFNELVESKTGRTVRARLSQTRVDADLTVDLFVLEPEQRDTDPPE